MACDVFGRFAKVVINKKPPIEEHAVHEVEPIRPVAPRMRTHWSVVGKSALIIDFGPLGASYLGLYMFVQFVLQNFFLEDDWMLTN
jgi:S-ribosylhomocysteine lyase LuxS involved in autoinducer biosynthesis